MGPAGTVGVADGPVTRLVLRSGPAGGEGPFRGRRSREAEPEYARDMAGGATRFRCPRRP